MPTTLDARFIVTEDDGEIITVGFADDQYDTKEHVLLTRARHVTAQERELGEDQVHINIGDQIRSVYGGILRAELSPESVRIQVDQEASRELESEQEIIITISNANPDLSDLAEKMRLLFEDSSEVFRSNL